MINFCSAFWFTVYFGKNMLVIADEISNLKSGFAVNDEDIFDMC
jgi:hypothetical protein